MVNKALDAAVVSTTFYDVLHVCQSATAMEIKAAYRHVLLSSHPDKYKGKDKSQLMSANTVDMKTPFDIAIIQDAYRILMDPVARATYDQSLKGVEALKPRSSTSVPRPAHIISLEDFTCCEPDQEGYSSWTHPCRCGGIYTINERDMENDEHLVVCERCSEAVYVGYEAVEEDECNVYS